MNTAMGIKEGNHKNYYSALSTGGNAAFSQSKNIFKHLQLLCMLRGRTRAFPVFLGCRCIHTGVQHLHTFFCGCLSDSGSFCGAGVSEKNPFSHPVDSITVWGTS